MGRKGQKSQDKKKKEVSIYLEACHIGIHLDGDKYSHIVESSIAFAGHNPDLQRSARIFCPFIIDMTAER